MKESEIQKRVQLAASDAGWTLWRNNVGLGWTGEITRLADGSMLIHNPRPIHAGLCKGSSDLIGLKPVVITESMLGLQLAQFVGVEVKSRRGAQTDEQVKFTDFVRSKGGHVVIARSAEDIA